MTSSNAKLPGSMGCLLREPLELGRDVGDQETRRSPRERPREENWLSRRRVRWQSRPVWWDSALIPQHSHSGIYLTEPLMIEAGN